MKNYVYIFVRQDISPEQQAVQAAHVTMKLGYQMRSNAEVEYSFPNESTHQLSWADPNDTYFTLVGVRNLDALNAVDSILATYNMEYEVFFEPDLNFGEITAIAVYPLPEDKRGPLLAFNLLRMK